MFVRRGLGACALALAATIGIATQVAAQSVRLDQYRPAETPEDGFAISRPDDLGHLRFGAQLHTSYALDPLVYQFRRSDPATEISPIVEHHLAMHAGLSFGLFDRLVLYAGLPVSLVMSGQNVDGQPRADGTSLGDLVFGLRLRLFGERNDAFALALQATGTAPTANAARFNSRFAGEGSATLQPEVLAEVRIADVVRIDANLGVIVRERQNLGSLEVRSEFTWGAGVSIGIVRDVLDAHLETWGSTSLLATSTGAGPGSAQLTPMEWLGGLRVQPLPGLRLGLAAGTGIQRGYGSPDFRGVFTFGYATPASTAPADTDGDGITDDRDECDDEPEDDDDFQDEDGCPDADNDSDGIPDGNDSCRNDPEDRDGNADDDGCPEEDADGDGIADGNDSCPMERGVASERSECNGCPAERCAPEPAPEPEPQVQIEQSTERVVIETIYFDFRSPELRPDQSAALERARQYMASHPEARVVLVEGHADFRGEDETNVQISRRRARRVRRWLLNHGVAASRIVAVGCGEQYPLVPGQNEEGLQQNRRVELRVLEPQAGEGRRAGCVELR